MFDGVIQSSFGVTLGKRVAGLSLERKDHAPLLPGEVFSRNWDLFLTKLWLGIPILSLVGCYMVYRNYYKPDQNNWDRRNFSQVISIGNNVWRTSLTALLFFAVFLSQAVLLVAFDPSHVLGEAMDRGDYAAEARLARPLAEAGGPNAQVILGGLYYRGQGVPRDVGEAQKWFEMAADQGNALGETSLGRLYLGNKNFERALYWFGQAANQGDAGGETSLAGLYYTGEGVPKNYQTAIEWYRKAADQGDVDSEDSLGTIYSDGQAVPVNYGEALKWYQRAADQGDPDAQYGLGQLYAGGLGVETNNIAAYKWFSLAAASQSWPDAADRDRAASERAAVAAKMTAEQISEAQRQVDNWVPAASTN
jgi:TPR repeat protein